MKTNRTVSVLAFLASFLLHGTIEANEGVSLLIKAYQNSGFNPTQIRSGVAEFEITTDRGKNSTSSKISEEMQRKDEKMIRERYKGDAKRIALELERIRASHEESQRRIIQEKVKIQMSGNDRTFGGEPGERYKRLYEKHEYVPSLNKWVHESIDLTFGTLLLRSNTTKSQLHIHWIPNNRDLIIKDSSSNLGEFQEFGRFQEEGYSRVSFIVREKIDRKTFALPDDFQEFFTSKIQSWEVDVNVTEEIDYDGGAKAKIVEVKKGDKLLEKYHIDADRGYLVPYQYVTEESGNFSIEKTAMEYAVEKKTGLYYPASYREIMKVGADNETNKEYRLVPDTLRLNQAVSDKEFAIDIPENSRVADFRDTENQVHHVAVQAGAISLAKGGYDLPKLSWLVREDRLEDYVPSSGGVGNWVRWLLMGSGAIIILATLYVKWKKRFA